MQFEFYKSIPKKFTLGNKKPSPANFSCKSEQKLLAVMICDRIFAMYDISEWNEIDQKSTTSENDRRQSGYTYATFSFGDIF